MFCASFSVVTKALESGRFRGALEFRDFFVGVAMMVAKDLPASQPEVPIAPESAKKASGLPIPQKAKNEPGQ